MKIITPAMRARIDAEWVKDTRAFELASHYRYMSMNGLYYQLDCAELHHDHEIMTAVNKELDKRYIMEQED